MHITTAIIIVISSGRRRYKQPGDDKECQTTAWLTSRSPLGAAFWFSLPWGSNQPKVDSGHTYFRPKSRYHLYTGIPRALIAIVTVFSRIMMTMMMNNVVAVFALLADRPERITLLKQWKSLTESKKSTRFRRSHERFRQSLNSGTNNTQRHIHRTYR